MGTTLKEPRLALIHTESGAKNYISIPPIIMKKIYSLGSLKNLEDGVSFSIKNPMKDALITELAGVSINGLEIALDDVSMSSDGTCLKAIEVSPGPTFPFTHGPGC